MSAKSGFTLTEILIVTLLIAILSAIGVTQYFKVVRKGKMSAALPVLSRIVDAENVHKDKTGNFIELAAGDPDLAKWNILGFDAAPHDTLFNYGFTQVTGGVAVLNQLGAAGAYAMPVPWTTGQWGNSKYFEIGVAIDERVGSVSYDGTYENWTR